MGSGAGPTVLEVRPDTVRVLSGGTGVAAPGVLVAAALDWIDDPVGLLDESPVAVAELWHAVMAAALGHKCDSVVVVHPADWPASRVGRVLAAANAFADRVVAVDRTKWALTDAKADAQADAQADDSGDHRARRWPGGATWLLPVAASVIALLVGSAQPKPDPGPQALVEGRVAVQVPPLWTVERITGGPGSRRVQVSSPSEADVALHITQSYAPEMTLAEAADVLRRAIASQPAGVFVDFRADDVVVGRPAVTYREIRPGRVIRWAAIPAGATRIGIGCQSPPELEHAVRSACDEAVRSARDLGTDSGQ